MQIITYNFSRGWFKLLCNLINSETVAPRGQASREQVGVTLQVTSGQENILFHPKRAPNYRFMVAEWLWIWFGCSDVKTIAQYNSQIAQFSDNGNTFDGAYGPRVRAQWPYIVESFKRDFTTRQAVISIFSPRALEEQSKDVPCTLTIQFLMRFDAIHTIICMRSSDVWLGLPYDFFNFSMLGNILAGQLGARVGSVTMHLGSSHLYERNLQVAKEVVRNENDLGCICSPYLGGAPPEELKLRLIQPVGTPMLLPGNWQHYADALSGPTSALALNALRSVLL